MDFDSNTEAAKLLADKALALQSTDALLRELNALRPLTEPAVARLLEEIKLQSTYDSNAIEGSTLTLRETVLVVKEGIAPGKGCLVRDLFAAKGYAYGFDAIFDFIDREQPCDEALIRQLLRYVMLGDLPECCGNWRNHEVRVLGADFRPAAADTIPVKMAELIDWFASEKELHPIEKAALFHAKFEIIHPFADGNGRTGRLLLNFMLVREGYWPVNIRYGEDHLCYYEALESYHTNGNVDALTALIAVREAAQLSYCIDIARQQENARARTR